MTNVLAAPNSRELSVEPGGSIEINPQQFPWLSAGGFVSLARVTHPTGEGFRFGSIVSFHTGVRKIADQVHSDKSASTQQTLLRAAPMLLDGVRHPNVVKMESPQEDMPKVFSVCANMAKMPRMLVAVVDVENDPAILKLGISNPKDNMRLLGIIGVSAPNQSVYRK